MKAAQVSRPDFPPDDLVKRVVREFPELKAPYYNALDALTFGHIEVASFCTKLSSLADSLTALMDLKTLSFETFMAVLDEVEAHLFSLETSEDVKCVEVMFFETLLNVFAAAQERGTHGDYIRLFKNHLGPFSQDLCAQNHAFWGTS